MRNSIRKHGRNSQVKSTLKSLEKGFLDLVQSGKKDEAAQALRTVASAMDKAAKRGAIHRRRSDRKKSRLANRLAALK